MFPHAPIRILAAATTLFFLEGCAPSCGIDVRPALDKPVRLETTRACFSRQGDTYRLLAVVPSRPDLLSLISPDGGTPAYYLELVLHEPSEANQAEARVIIKPHHSVGVFQGVPYNLEWQDSEDRIHVRCRVFLTAVPDKTFAGRRLLQEAHVEITGEFTLDPQTYAKADGEIRVLLKWLDSL